MATIYSTLTAGMTYCTYKPGGDGRPVEDKRIVIRGGNMLRAEHDGRDRGITTPEGVVTEISEEDLAILETIPVFQVHKAGGFIVAIPGNKKSDKLKIVSQMTKTDLSTQRTPGYFIKKREEREKMGDKEVVNAPIPYVTNEKVAA